MFHFYPRSPCGERRDVIAVMTDAQSISIHALLAESDHAPSHSLYPSNNFYPRSPCGERLSTPMTKPVLLSNFYPRSPCGERRRVPVRCWRLDRYFYPRSPCGERLPKCQPQRTIQKISIHALLAESDRLCTILYSWPGNFYPRSPCGERQ